MAKKKIDRVKEARGRVTKLQGDCDHLAADLVKQNAQVATAGAADRFDAQREADGLAEALAASNKMLSDAKSDLNAAKVEHCISVVNQARSDFDAASDGSEVLAIVDLHIGKLGEIHEVARDIFSDTRDLFGPGERQPVEVRCQYMAKHLDDLRSARDALAALL